MTPYEKGVSACRRGKRTDDNPYSHVSVHAALNFREWLRGFADQAQREADTAVVRSRRRQLDDRTSK